MLTMQTEKLMLALITAAYECLSRPYILPHLLFTNLYFSQHKCAVYSWPFLFLRLLTVLLVSFAVIVWLQRRNNPKKLLVAKTLA